MTLNKNSTTARLQPSFLCLSARAHQRQPSAAAPARLPATAASSHHLSPRPAPAQPRAAPRTGTSSSPTPHVLAWWHVTLSRLGRNSTYSSWQVLSAPRGPETAGSSWPASSLAAVRQSQPAHTAPTVPPPGC